MGGIHQLSYVTSSITHHLANQPLFNANLPHSCSAAAARGVVYADIMTQNINILSLWAGECDNHSRRKGENAHNEHECAQSLV